MSVITKSATSRAYNIRLTQLKGNEAPFNCLQYYTDPEGWIQTFNYEDASKFVEFRNPSYFVRKLKLTSFWTESKSISDSDGEYIALKQLFYSLNIVSLITTNSHE